MKRLLVFVVALFCFAFFGCQNPMGGIGDEPASSGGILNKIATAAVQAKSELHAIRSYPTSKNIGLQFAKQERSNWCAAASVSMLQIYFNQTAGASQTDIATYLGILNGGGAYMGDVVNWLNSSPMTGYKVLPSWWVWELHSIAGNYNEFRNSVQWSFAGNNAPEIWPTRTVVGSYKLPGYSQATDHYIAGRGYNFSSDVVYYNDPNNAFSGTYGNNLSVATYTMFKCIEPWTNIIY
jgi:predicted small secreted protein